MTTSTTRIATWKLHAPTPHCQQNRAEIASGVHGWPLSGARQFSPPTANVKEAVEMARQVPSTRMFFETADYALAAFLQVHQCEPVGFGIGEENDPAPVITHLFDDDAQRIVTLVGKYTARKQDEVSAGAFVHTYCHLRRRRLDHGLRIRRQAESDLAKQRGDMGGER